VIKENNPLVQEIEILLAEQKYYEEAILLVTVHKDIDGDGVINIDYNNCSLMDAIHTILNLVDNLATDTDQTFNEALDMLNTFSNARGDCDD